MNPAVMMMLASMAAPALGQFGGKDAKFGSTYTKGQQGLMDQITNMAKGQGGQDITQNQNYNTGQDWLQSMFNDPKFFENFEAPLKRDFEENTVPGLANQFAGMGSGGNLDSSAFRNQLAREGSNLHTNIAALRGGMQQNAIPQLMQYAQQPFQNLMSMYNTALGPQPNNQYFPATPGPLGQIGASFAGGAANAFGQSMGNNMMKDWNAGGVR